MKIPSGTQDGEMIPIENKQKKGNDSNHFISIRVDIPKTLTPKERELFTRLRAHAKKV